MNYQLKELCINYVQEFGMDVIRLFATIIYTILLVQMLTDREPTGKCTRTIYAPVKSKRKIWLYGCCQLTIEGLQKS